MAVNLKSLIGKLDDAARNTLEAAAGICLSRTHYSIEIEHYLIKLLDRQNSDFSLILKHFEVREADLASDLSKSLDRMKTGNGRTPVLSQQIVKMLTEAWSLASVEYGGERIRTGHTILALVQQEELARLVREISPLLSRINAETLRKDLPDITQTSEENTAPLAVAKPAEPGQPEAVATNTPFLDQYTQDLTKRAHEGHIDPVIGRDTEIRQLIDVLLRRRQNNPILTGEAGVGKTAVVEGFALRVSLGDVPPPLRNVSVRTLDLTLLQAGAGVKGEFENRLKSLIEEVKSSPAPVILFIDEAHTMIGAGGAAGQNDAANILKPALARGELRTIAATTWPEYKKYFEKDPALTRRFQVVKVDEPSESVCMLMLRGLVPALEAHHKVRILEEAISAAVHLSHRYIADRQLPDKAVSVLDTACARLSLSHDSTPAHIEAAVRELDALQLQHRVLSRESITGSNHSESLATIANRIAELEVSLEELKTRWDRIRASVSETREIRTQMEALHGADRTPDPVRLQDLRARLAALEAETGSLQGETHWLRVSVDAQAIADVVGGWTGIPVGKLLRDDVNLVLNLESHLSRRLIGQSHALRMVSERIRTSKSSLDDPGKPVGVFLLVGPSGVGKTETAISLAELLYGGERNLITINMSEFQEAHTVSTLKGSPPGYVGYGEGGVLTEAVRRRPYSVVLLDEAEKAHPDVLEFFYRIFDKGVAEDGEGREINFRNTIILLTTNAASEQIATLTSDPDTMPAAEALVRAIKPELNKIFKPALLGRLVIVPYYPVRDEVLRDIVRLKLNRIVQRLLDTHKLRLEFGDETIAAIASRCTEVESGARNVDNILTNSLLPDVSRRILTGIANDEAISRILVSVGEKGEFLYA